MARLDGIVKALEGGEKPLDEAISLFTEGTGLIQSCGKMLDEAEQKVVKLQKGPDGAPVESDFGTEG